MLLDSDTSGPPLPDKSSFRVPDSVFRDAAARAGLTPEGMKLALSFQGPLAEQCKGRIGMIEAALAAPPSTGLELLQQL